MVYANSVTSDMASMVLTELTHVRVLLRSCVRMWTGRWLGGGLWLQDVRLRALFSLCTVGTVTRIVAALTRDLVHD